MASKKMITTVRLSQETKRIVESFKIIPQESYDSAIRRAFEELVENELELNKETKKMLKERVAQVKAGNVMTINEFLKARKEKRIKDGKS